MPTRHTRLSEPRRGATLALMAVVMVALLAMIALAVDLGMAFTARSEAQRVADAAALAGGSAFLDLPVAQATGEARDRAYDYALRNVVRNEPVDSSEVTVQVLPDEKKVRVWINRGGLPTWFARVLGIDEVDVGAMAAAQAVEAGEARCLKPFAVPDVWHDADDDTDPTNRWWDEGEEWIFNPDAGDRYQRFDPTADNADQATGYGSAWRGDTNDYGRLVQIKVSDPRSEYQPVPSVFLPWRIPEDPNMEDCPASMGGGGGSQGAAVYRKNICSCNQSAVELFTPYDIEPGNMIGPTDQGVEALIDQDPDAYWDPDANGGRGEVISDMGLSSPRVIKIALFDPRQITGSGMQSIEFNNFALMFLEGQASRNDPVIARFLYFAGGTGTGDGTTTGSLVLYLRLVE